MSKETDRQIVGGDGFTLIEVMVASLVFAIGMLGVLAMQYTALGGYTFSRDLTGATQVGRRIAEIAQAESQQWRSRDSLAQTGTVGSVYTTSNGYWNHDSLLQAVVDDEWAWQTVFAEPVDIRLSDAGNRRYCVYLRGGELADPNRAGASSSTGIIQMQIAVAFPDGDGMFPGVSSSRPAGSCSGQVDVSGTEKRLIDVIDPVEKGSVPTYEKAGFSAVHLGTTIVQRKHLKRGGRNRRRGGS